MNNYFHEIDRDDWIVSTFVSDTEEVDETNYHIEDCGGAWVLLDSARENAYGPEECSMSFYGPMDPFREYVLY